MPSYIGKEPQQAYNSPDKDRFSGDGSTTAFTLSRTVANAADLEVFVGNVQQEPLVAYTTSAQTLTFTEAPATGSNNIYVIHRNGGMQTLALPTGQAGDFSSVTASGDVSVTGDLTVTGNIIGDVEITGTTPKLTIGDAGALSFDFGKIITTGEGGMLLTNNRKLDKYAREYHDHGHENNPSLPRGKDTKTIYGFNYRMTEMQGAIGRVQLKKLTEIIKKNKLRYQALYGLIKNKFKFRRIPASSETIFDTLIFIEENKKIRKKIIKVLVSEGFGTKNLPDAIEWHCASYWNHALTKDQILRSKITQKLLEKTIAVPIWIRRAHARITTTAVGWRIPS